MRKKWIAVGLAAAMFLSAVPIQPMTVKAADSIELEAENYNSYSGTLKVLTNDSNASGGAYVGDFDNLDCVSYMLNIEKAGNYRVAMRISTQNTGGTAVLNSGGNLSEEIAIPNTGSWTTYQDVTATLWLESGEQVLTVTNTNSTWNLDKLTLSYLDSEIGENEYETYEDIYLQNRWKNQRIVERNESVQYADIGAGDYGTAEAQWKLVPDAEGWYTIQNLSSDNYLIMTEGTQAVSSAPDGNTTDAGKWRIGTIKSYQVFYNKQFHKCGLNLEYQADYPNQVLATEDCLIKWYSAEWKMDVPASQHEYTIGAEKIEGTAGTAVATDGTSITVNQNGAERTWTLTEDISAEPVFTAENMPMLEAVYNLSMEESLLNIHDGTYGKVFWTGTNWSKVWTRDTAMSVQYSLAWIFPEETKNSILEKVIGGTDNPQIWEEDTGTGGSYPNSIDRIIMEIAGWELYKTTGDEEFLAQIYDISKNTLEQDYHVAYDEISGLFKGETGGLDHRSKTYPDWMDENEKNSIVNIADSKAANANIIFAGALGIMAESARILGKDEAEIAEWEEKYNALKQAINERLWLEDRGMYASWEYPEYMGSPVADKVDVIANGYALMLDIADEQQKQQIMENYPLVVYGADTVWPQKNGRQASTIYHNRGVWPGWEAALMIGAKENGNLQLAEEIFKSCVRGAGMSLTNKEVINFETGEGIASDRQLWSIAGTLAGYYRVLFGMVYEQEGITFEPYVPEWMEGPFSLSNYTYRDAVLNLTVNGTGDTLTSITVNGEEKPLDYILPTDAQGTYNIVMNVEDSGERSKIHLEEDSWAVCPDLPVLTEEADGRLTWEENPEYTYKLWTGKEYVEVSGGSYTPSRDLYGAYSLVAVDKNGVTSEMSKPVIISPESSKLVYEAEEGEYSSGNFEATASGYTGTGYVVDFLNKKTDMRFHVEVPQTGRYQVSMIYNNYGSATDGQDCGIRSVYVDGEDVGTFVFPVVKFDFQQSTYLFLNLEKGEHTIDILYNVDDWYDTNMTTSRGTAKNSVCYDSLSLQYLPESVISEKPEIAFVKPVRGGSVAETGVTVNGQGLPYSVSLVWMAGKNEAGATFEEGTAYTAVITLTAGEGCIFSEDTLPTEIMIEGDTITLAEGEAVFNEGRTVLTITHTFEETEKDLTSKALLSIVYEAYKKLDVSAYTEESAQALQNALDAAALVLANADADDDEIAQAAEDIMTAAAGLILDTTDLSAALQAAADAAAAANETAQGALAEAAKNKAAADLAQALAEEAQRAAEAAQTQAASAEKEAKKSMLMIVYNAYKDMDTTGYTAASAEELSEALTAAGNVIANADADAEAFVQATEDIMKAAADLVIDTSDLEAAAEAARQAADAAQRIADEAKTEAAANKSAAELAQRAADAAQQKAEAAEQAAKEAKEELEEVQKEAAAQKEELEKLAAQAEAAQKAAEEARANAEAAEKAALEAKAAYEKAQQPGAPEPAIQIVEGKTYDSGDYSYKVTDVENLTAEVVGIKNTALTKIAVYNNVTLGGKSYKVTSIGASAFKGNKKATSAVIGKNVETIGSNAFAGCTKLKKVTAKSTVLTQIGGKAFYNCKNLKTLTLKSKVLKKAGANALKGIHKKAVIKVPAAKYKAYVKLLAKKGQSKTVKIKK